MSNKLTNKYLNLILRYPSRNKGFALPIALGMGLFLLLVSSLMMFRSQDDRATASAQKSISQGLNAAETGLTRYQNLINNNRPIATYPNDAPSGTPDWSAASTIPGVSSCGGDVTQITSVSGTGWQDVDSTDLSKGQYRLVSYTFTPDSGSAPVAPGTATLIVEGRVNQNGSGNTATKDVGTSTSRVKVTIPINTVPTGGLSDTGLWATEFNFNGNNPRANANVLDSSCSSATTLSTSYIGNLPTPPYPANTRGTYERKVIPFPTLPNNNVYSPPTSNVNTISCGSNPMNFSGNSSVTFPRNGDIDSTGKVYGSTTAPPDANATYTYVNPCSASIDLTGQARITFGRSGQETINVYAGGDVKASGNGGMGPYTNGTATTKAIFYVQGSIDLAGNGSAFSPTYFQFYKYGTTGSVKLNGNGSSSAFIFAPFVETQLVGNATVNGVVWTKKISANGNASINQGKIDTTALQITSSTNVLGTPSSWERQQAN